MNPGDFVRVRTQPDRKGVLLNSFRAGNLNRWNVQFPDCSQAFPESNLERISADQTVSELIINQHYGRASNVLFAILKARLSGKLADMVYSMEATNTEYFPYQFKPVISFFESPARGILIADEVGLGKTIEAGLIWTELKAREDANKLLIVCPAVLQKKWQKELLHRFGMRSDIVDSNELLQRLQEENEYANEGFCLIASLQGLRPTKNWDSDSDIQSPSAKLSRYFQEHVNESSIFDCVIVDEAHYLRNSSTQSHKLIALIREVTESIVLLSATPIQLHTEDLHNLLKVIDHKIFESKYAFELVMKANKPLIKMVSILRNEKASLNSFLENLKVIETRNMLLSNSHIQNLIKFKPSKNQFEDISYRASLANRLEKSNYLSNVVSRTRKKDVQESKVIREVYSPTISMTKLESNFYNLVTESALDYCISKGLSEGFILGTPQRQVCSSMPAAIRAWRKKIFVEKDELFEMGNENHLSLAAMGNDTASEAPLIRYLATKTSNVSFDVLKQEDSKVKTLIELLESYFTENPNQKIIIFSFFKETLRYLSECLEENSILCHTLFGGIKLDKDTAVQEFKDAEDVRVMLASEVLSEGVDMQFCSALINYDLPWNPMRVEQRIGRIDRIGQKKGKILIWNFFYENSIDDKIYNRLLNRLQIFESSLGDIESVIGEQINKLTKELFTHRLSEEQIDLKITQTALAIENEKILQLKLEEEAPGLEAHSDYILNKVTAAREMRRYLDGRQIWAFVKEYMSKEYPGCRFIEKNTSEVVVDLELSTAAKIDFSKYLIDNKNKGKTGLVSSISGKPTTCIFHNKVDFGHSDYEVVGLHHPLVQFVSDATKNQAGHQLAAVKISSFDSDIPEGRYLIVVKRWTTRGEKIIERIVYKGRHLETKKYISDNQSEILINECIRSGIDWASVKNDIESESIVHHYEIVENELDARFVEYHEEKKIENSDSIDFQISNLKNKVDSLVNSGNQAIETLRLRNRANLIPAQEGKILKAQERYQLKKAQLESRRGVSSNPSDVITVLINVG